MKGPGRVDPDHVHAGKGHRGLGRLPDALELRPWPREARRRVRNVVVPRHREHRRPERAQERSRLLELRPAAAMGEIARGDDELRLEALDEPGQRPCVLDSPLLVRAHVKIRNVEEACCHGRTRL